jgi:glycerophosphoryl diester phosphodiesterase
MKFESLRYVAVSRRAILGTAVAGALSSAFAAPATRSAQPTTPRKASKVELFAHRGSCAVWPEHTFGSYVQAIADGADYVEPDLVCTRDGVLVARHESNIVETTDVASRPEFAARRATKTIDSQVQSGWFVEDFTLAELKTLRAIERLPKIRSANTRYDGLFQIPTWDEIINLAAAESLTRKRVIGLVPEIKNSTHFASIGLPMEDRFLASLADHAYTRTAPVEIQSFETANLKYLRAKLGRPSNIRLMQLVGTADERPADDVAAGGNLTYGQMTSASGLAHIKTYADVVAPPIRSIIPLGPDGRLSTPTSLVADAHSAGLLVHTWVFRPENKYLAADFRDGAGVAARNPEGSIAEIRRYLDAGIDGFFSDDTAIGRKAIDDHRRKAIDGPM